jgi:hypothetical protein
VADTHERSGGGTATSNHEALTRNKHREQRDRRWNRGTEGAPPREAKPGAPSPGRPCTPAERVRVGEPRELPGRSGMALRPQMPLGPLPAAMILGAEVVDAVSGTTGSDRPGFGRSVAAPVPWPLRPHSGPRIGPDTSHPAQGRWRPPTWGRYRGVVCPGRTETSSSPLPKTSDARDLDASYRLFDGSVNPPVLHRKETFLATTTPDTPSFVG